MSRVDLKRDAPVEGTHLTELELQEMWYQHSEQIANEGGPPSFHRAHKRLFPRSRRDMIDYYTQKDLESWREGLVDENLCPGHVASRHDSKVCLRCGIHIDSLRPESDYE